MHFHLQIVKTKQAAYRRTYCLHSIVHLSWPDSKEFQTSAAADETVWNASLPLTPAHVPVRFDPASRSKTTQIHTLSPPSMAPLATLFRPPSPNRRRLLECIFRRLLQPTAAVAGADGDDDDSEFGVASTSSFSAGDVGRRQSNEVDFRRQRQRCLFGVDVSMIRSR